MICEKCGNKTKIDELSFWWMHDNHTFTQLIGNTLDEIIEHINKLKEESPYGMLCPVTGLSNGRDLRKVGKMCHWDMNKIRWKKDLSEWRKAIEQDEEVMGFLK